MVGVKGGGVGGGLWWWVGGWGRSGQVRSSKETSVRMIKKYRQPIKYGSGSHGQFHQRGEEMPSDERKWENMAAVQFLFPQDGARQVQSKTKHRDRNRNRSLTDPAERPNFCGEKRKSPTRTWTKKRSFLRAYERWTDGLMSVCVCPMEPNRCYSQRGNDGVER